MLLDQVLVRRVVAVGYAHVDRFVAGEDLRRQTAVVRWQLHHAHGCCRGTHVDQSVLVRVLVLHLLLVLVDIVR